MGINIYDVAQDAKVSSTTVSRVINGSPHVKEETKAKVMKSIEELGYTPSALARNLSTGDTHNIGFLVPDIENPFFSMILSGVSKAADEYGYNIFIFNTADDTGKEHRFLEAARAERLRGLLVIPVDSDDEKTYDQLRSFVQDGVPVVLVDRNLRDGRFDGVFSEDFFGSVQAVTCLLKEGHKRIAIINGPENSRPGNERWKGYKEALSKWGIPIQKQYVRQGDFHQERAYAAMAELMRLENPPTAVFSSNNLTSIGCIRYALEHGLLIGTDISLIGFDDIDLLQAVGIRLSVVDRDTVQMGWKAMKLLIQRIHKADEDDVATNEIYMPTRLILRGSEKWRKPHGAI